MTNFLDTVLTKTATIPDARNVTTLWKRNGDRKIKKKNERFGLGIEKTTGNKFVSLIKIFTQITKRKDVIIRKNMLNKTLKLKKLKPSCKKLSKKVMLYVRNFAKFVEKLAKDLMDTIVTMISLSTSYGFAKVAIFQFIKRYYRERLSEKTPKGEATVRTTQETRRGRSEEVSPPFLKWSVSHMAESNRKQCINNDLWVQNLRSTGLQGV